MTVIYGVILAGGQGNRLQQQDKGLLHVGNERLVQCVVKLLSPQVNKILISANRNIETYESLGFKVLKDDFKGFEGPLAGLCRVMEELETYEDQPEFIIIVPCDAPLFPADLVKRLHDEYVRNETLAVIPYDGSRVQPLFGLYSLNAFSSLKDYLARGNRKVIAWVESIPHKVVDFSENADAFLNINTETELEAARKIFLNDGHTFTENS